MNEKQLQAKIVTVYYQKHPKKTGQLIHIPNERNHALQAIQARSLGIYPGVADMLFFSKKYNVCTELKVPGTTHKIAQVKAQIRWGRIWLAKGKRNHWRLCKTIEEAVSCYEGNYKGMTLDEVEAKLKAVLEKKPNVQSIKF